MRKSLAELISERQHTTEIQVTDWGGAVQLAKLPPRERVELLERIADKTDEGGNIPIATALDEYVWAISKSVAADEGSRGCDSDDGREFLVGERLDVLQQVFQAVAEWNLGNLDAELETAKKN